MTRIVLVLLVAVGAGAVILIASEGSRDSNPTVSTPPPGRISSTTKTEESKVATLSLARGNSRASFLTRYPGGSFDAWLTAPRTTRFHFFIRVLGRLLDGFPTFNAGHCRTHGPLMVCHAASFEAIPTAYNPWRVWVVKTSKPAARIKVRLSFTGTSAGS